MALDMCSENSSTAMAMSPRISFSHDLSQSDIVPVEQLLRTISSSSGVDFNFCVHENFENQPSYLADEIFSNGKILPTTQINKKGIVNIVNVTPPSKNQESAEISSDQPEKAEKHNNKEKSFWGFKRSNSLNCGSGYARSLCPLPLLNRSNSTGSSTSSKRLSSSKAGLINSKQQHSQKSSQFSHKPPLRKTNYNSRIRVNPVLNVPTANLFGLGSFFSGGKDKNKKNGVHG